MLRSLVVAALLLAPGPAAAEIVSRSENAFTLRFAVGLEATQDDVMAAVADIPLWWDPAHTYTGDGSNLSLRLEPGGCWCERMTDGSVFEHAVVTAIEPRRVTFRAPLGPLKNATTRAELIFSAGPENRGAAANLEFVVEGPAAGVFAEPVHGVMQQAWNRFVRFIEYGEASPAN